METQNEHSHDFKKGCLPVSRVAMQLNILEKLVCFFKKNLLEICAVFAKKNVSFFFFLFCMYLEKIFYSLVFLMGGLAGSILATTTPPQRKA